MEEQKQKTVYDEIRVSTRFELINKAFASIDKNISTIDFTKIRDTSNEYTKDQLLQALSVKSEQNTKILIQASNYFYTRSGEYRQLLHRFAGIHKYRNVIYPRIQFDKKANVKKLNDRIGQYVLNSRIEETCLNITIKSLLDGTAYTYEEVKDDKSVQQFLPSDYCRTRTMDNFGNKIVEFNFKYFDEAFQDTNQRELIFKQLPKEFKKLYADYKAGKNNLGDTRNHNWQQLNPDFARATTFSLDGTPYFCAIFPDLLDYEAYKELNQLSSELDLFTILVQVAELDDDGNPTVDDETMERLSKTLATIAKTGGCGALTTPYKVEALKMKDKQSEQKIDYVQTGLTGIYNASSLPEIAFNSSSKNGGTAGLNASNAMTGGIFDIVLSQYRNWYFKKFNEISTGKILFDIDFIPITCFNEKEMIMLYKEQFTLGGSGFYYFSALGINQFEITSLLSYENELGFKEMLQPPPNAYAPTDNNGAGRPPKDDNEKADSTQTQQNNGVDKSRAGAV